MVKKKSLKELEARKKELSNIMVETSIKNEWKHEMTDLWQRLHEERRQAVGEDNMAKTKESENWIKKEYEQEEALAKEMEALNREELRELKYKQLLMDSPEIRDLHQQLKTAYVNKELSAQIELNKYLKQVAAKDEGDRTDELAKYREEELKEREEEMKRKKEYRECLQDQIINGYIRKQEEYKELLREKALMDDALRSVLEEDKREVEIELLKKKRCKEEIDAFMQAKAVWMQREKEIQEAEERRENAYLEEKKKRDERVEEEFKMRNEKLKSMKETVSKFLTHHHNTRDEHERVLQLLAEEEIRQKEELRECQEKQKEERAKIELRMAFHQQINDKLERLKKEKEMERIFYEQKLAEYSEDKRLEQMTADKKKILMMDYRLSIQRELEEKKYRREVEINQLMKWKQMEEEASIARREAIEAERLRLLKEHAGHLVGYLPKGMLKQDDLVHMPEPVAAFYGRKSAPAASSMDENIDPSECACTSQKDTAELK